MCETIAPKVFRLNDNRQSEVADPAGDSVEKVWRRRKTVRSARSLSKTPIRESNYSHNDREQGGSYVTAGVTAPEYPTLAAVCDLAERSWVMRNEYNVIDATVISSNRSISGPSISIRSSATWHPRS